MAARGCSNRLASTRPRWGQRQRPAFRSSRPPFLCRPDILFYAVKRYEAQPKFWRFLSDNPVYAPVEIEKAEMPYPILGIFVASLKIEGAKIMS